MITLKTEAKRVGEMYYCIDSKGSILGVSPENTNKWQDASITTDCKVCSL